MVPKFLPLRNSGQKMVLARRPDLDLLADGIRHSYDLIPQELPHNKSVLQPTVRKLLLRC